MSKSQRIVLFILLFATMFVFGMAENIKGVSFPLIREEFNASWEQLGFMVSMFSIAYVGFCIIAGLFLGRFGIKPSYLLGFASLCVGLFLVFFMQSFFLAAAALFVVFASLGFFEIGVNALAARLFITKAALLMNVLHSFYGIGAMIGPRAAGLIVNNTPFGWRHVYVFLIPLALILFISAVFIRFPQDSPEVPKETTDTGDRVGNGGNSFFDALRSPHVWLLSITLGLAVAVELNSSNWGLLYFWDMYKIDPSVEGAVFLSAFYLAFTVSRLVCGSLIERIGYIRSLLGLACIVLAVFLVCFFLGAKGIYILPALGFFVALFWPTLMAVAVVSFGRKAAVYCSAMIVIAGLFNAAVQFFIGYTNKMFGPAWGYRSSIIYTVLLIIILLLVRVKFTRSADNNF